MNLPKTVAKIRLRYHLEMVDVNNVLYQLHLRGEEKAEKIGAKHTMASLDCFERLGIPVYDEILKKS